MNIRKYLKDNWSLIRFHMDRYPFELTDDIKQLERVVLQYREYTIIPTEVSQCPYVLRYKDDTLYVPMIYGKKVYLFYISEHDDDSNSITKNLDIVDNDTSLDYNEYGLPSKKSYKINTKEDITNVIENFYGCDDIHKKELASNIVSRCNEIGYDMSKVQDSNILNHFNNNSNNMDSLDWILRTGDGKDFKPSTRLVEDYLDFSNYFDMDIIGKVNTVFKVVEFIEIDYLRHYLKSASFDISNSTILAIKNSMRFDKLYSRKGANDTELLFGVAENYLGLLVMNNNDIVMIPLVDNSGIVKINLEGLTSRLKVANKLKVRQLMLRERSDNNRSITESISVNGDDVKFDISVDTLSGISNRLESCNIQISTMLNESDQEGVIEGMVSLIYLRENLDNFPIINIETIDDSRQHESLMESSSRLFKESFSKLQKISSINFVNYCCMSDTIKVLFEDEKEMETIIKRQMRKMLI